ncbi:MAG: FAD-dependent monooxygenase, partial [Trebonia sp.]
MRTLIVGGGPAGLTAAIALRHRGVTVDLVEASSDPTVLGTGLSLGGAPLRALTVIGLADRCVQAGFGSTTLTIGTAEGDVVRVLDRPRLNGPGYPSTLGIMRPVLHALLSEAAVHAGARVRRGVTVRELIQQPQSVDVQLTDGRRSRYDLVLGAD